MPLQRPRNFSPDKTLRLAGTNDMAHKLSGLRAMSLSATARPSLPSKAFPNRCKRNGYHSGSRSRQLNRGTFAPSSSLKIPRRHPPCSERHIVLVIARAYRVFGTSCWAVRHTMLSIKDRSKTKSASRRQGAKFQTAAHQLPARYMALALNQKPGNCEEAP